MIYINEMHACSHVSLFSFVKTHEGEDSNYWHATALEDKICSETNRLIVQQRRFWIDRNVCWGKKYVWQLIARLNVKIIKVCIFLCQILYIQSIIMWVSHCIRDIQKHTYNNSIFFQFISIKPSTWRYIYNT